MVAVPLIIVSFGLFSLTDDDTATLPTISATSQGRAITFGEFDLASDGVVLSDDLERIRLGVSGDDLFVGVSDPADVNRFLAGIQLPTDSEIWTVSDIGNEASIRIDTTDARWSAVVMNVDGSRGVDADITATISATPVKVVSATVFGAGLMAAAASALLFVVAFRRPNPPAESVSERQPVAIG